MWSERYRPDTLSDFKGHSKEVDTLRDWAEEWEPGDDAVLLHGPPGAGKTALAHALANDLGMELFETNASEARTKSDVQERLLQAVQQRSFTGKQKLILVDEVDGMGRADRGGRSVVNEVLKKTKFPVILTANDPYADGMRSLRNKCTLIELGNVHTNSVAARLREIADAEGLEYEDGAMKAVARRASGDMRSAINDLQSLSGLEVITSDDVKMLGYRETERDIFEALKIVFKTLDADTASDASDGLDENYDDLLQWIRENVPKEYTKPGDRARAFDNLSRADVFRGRMMANQDWSLMKYVYELMTVGVALSKEEKYSGWTKYGYPSRLKKMGQSRASRATMERIGEAVGERLHMSVSEATDMIPVLQALFRHPPWKDNIVQELGLAEKEVEFIEDF